MSTIEDGGPAFPMQEPLAIHAYAIAAIDGITDLDERERAYIKARTEAIGGLSMRDYFAAAALQGLVAGDVKTDVSNEAVAGVAYALADAMLAARKENP